MFPLLSALAAAALGAPAPLVLTHTDVQASVQAGLAVVTVEQSFHNPYQGTIDAVYTFPLPEDAAVRHMELRCGERTLVAEVMEKQAARQVYEAARAEGRKAALTEQQRDNVFTQRVASICPGEEVSVLLELVTEPAWEAGVYTLALPTSVGARFAPTPDLELPPLEPVTRDTPYDLDVAVHITEGMPVESLWSDTHAFEVDEDPLRTSVFVSSHRDSDVHLAWTLAGAQPRASALVSEDGYLALSVEPRILADVEATRRRELLFVLDASGSMRGQPWDTATDAVRLALEQMSSGDTFNLVRFADSASSLFEEPQPATAANIERARQWLRTYTGGGTSMDAGIVHSLDMPGDAEAQRHVLLLTDGYIGDERRIFDLTEAHLGEARVFALGVGSSVNRHLLDGLAEAGRGKATYQLPGTPLQDTVDAFYETISHPVMTDITVDFGGLEVSEVQPRRIPDLYARQPLRLVGRVEGSGRHTITIEGLVQGVPYRLRVPVDLEEAPGDDTVLSTLWARRTIHDLEWDDTLGEPQRKERILEVALEHHLVSRFTSLIAEDTAPPACAPATRTVEVANQVPRGTDAQSLGAEIVDTPAVLRPGGGGREIIYRERTEIDFEYIDVQGSLITPSGELLLERRRARMSPTIRVRDDFDDEMREVPWAMTAVAPLEVMADAQEGVVDEERAAVLEVLADNEGAIQRILEEHLRANPGLRGQIELRIVLEEGRITEVEPIACPDGCAPLAYDLERLLRRLRFPEDLDVELVWTVEVGE